MTTTTFSSSPPPAFDPSPPTLLALALAISLLPTAQVLARLSLPQAVSRTHHYLFIWLVYDALTHFLLEGSFLYHCFTSYTSLPTPFSSADAHAAAPVSYTPAHVHFLGQEGRRYGPNFSDQPMARLWQEYAKADARWGGADLTIISLEILTVFFAAPCAAYLADLIRRINSNSNSSGKSKSKSETETTVVKEKQKGRLWVLAIMLSTGELYGGFMTFAPEWLSGNTSLYTDDKVFLWGYLVFANVIWVFVPAWVIWRGFQEVGAAFERAAGAGAGAAGGEVNEREKERTE